MKQYLKKDGTIVDRIPIAEDYIEDDQDAGVTQAFVVQLMDENLETVATESLYSRTYPKEASIKWCLLKHRNSGAVYASVRKLYTLEY